jgi:hypothetical protein
MADYPGRLSAVGSGCACITTHMVANVYSKRSHSDPTIKWNGMLHAVGSVEWETRYQVDREQLRCHKAELGIISDGSGIPLWLASVSRKRPRSGNFLLHPARPL